MGYPSSVQTFTTRNSGDTIQAAHVNDLQTEVNAVEGGLINGIAHDLLPLSNNTYDLGSDAKRYAEVHTQALAVVGMTLTPATITLTDGATPALNAALGTVFRLAAAGNRTIAVPTNAVAGHKIVIQHYASGGARTLALNTGAGGFRFGTDITALTETTSAKTDYIGAIYNGTDSFWDVVAYVKGF